MHQTQRGMQNQALILMKIAASWLPVQRLRSWPLSLLVGVTRVQSNAFTPAEGLRRAAAQRHLCLCFVGTCASRHPEVPMICA